MYFEVNRIRKQTNNLKMKLKDCGITKNKIEYCLKGLKDRTNEILHMF